MKIKICGMKYPENILEVAALGPDYMGFIFYPASGRYVEEIDHQVLSSLPKSLKKTGVFVNAGFDEIAGKADKYRLSAVQLHGDEPPELCAELKTAGLEVIKAAGIDETFDFNTLKSYSSATDYFLFDTRSKSYGGTGKQFDWTLLGNYRLETPYFLSGGLDQKALEKIQLIEDKRLYAVDLNSRFEISPGRKDVEELKKTITYLRINCK